MKATIGAGFHPWKSGAGKGRCSHISLTVCGMSEGTRVMLACMCCEVSWGVVSTPGSTGLTVGDTGHMTGSKYALPVPRCLVFLPLRAAYIAAHLGLLVGSKGEQEAARGVGIQRCLPALPGESTGGVGGGSGLLQPDGSHRTTAPFPRLAV